MGIRQNGIYSVHFVRINYSSENIADAGNTKESIFQHLADADNMKEEASYGIVSIMGST